MGREVGTIDCLVFLECKDQIEKMLVRLDKIDNTEHIVGQLQYKNSASMILLQHEQAHTKVSGELARSFCS